MITSIIRIIKNKEKLGKYSHHHTCATTNEHHRIQQNPERQPGSLATYQPSSFFLFMMLNFLSRHYFPSIPLCASLNFGSLIWQEILPLNHP